MFYRRYIHFSSRASNLPVLLGHDTLWVYRDGPEWRRSALKDDQGA
jgi:hypothetical protein